jgi:hypothetical protein
MRRRLRTPSTPGSCKRLATATCIERHCDAPGGEKQKKITAILDGA